MSSRYLAAAATPTATVSGSNPGLWVDRRGHPGCRAVVARAGKGPRGEPGYAGRCRTSRVHRAGERLALRCARWTLECLRHHHPSRAPSSAGAGPAASIRQANGFACRSLPLFSALTSSPACRCARARQRARQRRPRVKAASSARCASRSTPAVCGMFTVGLGLFGVAIVVIAYKGNSPTCWKATASLPLLAMFMRVGGGIYTKAADVGADLVGQVGAGHPRGRPQRGDDRGQRRRQRG